MKTELSVLNTLHFPIKVGSHTFLPRKEVIIVVDTLAPQFRNLRSTRGLRVGRHGNDHWLKKNPLGKVYQFNMVYDVYSQHRGRAYERVIESLAKPIIKHLPAGSAGFVARPVPGINLRFFSSMRIEELGKYPVGPYDVFYSHGIADKNYWIAKRINSYQNAFVPGPAWKERIEKGGYKGKVWVVGYTKLDPVFNGEYKQQKREKPYIVWAPTHGYNTKYTGRSSYPECMTLIREIPNCYEKTIALHPTTRMNNRQAHDVTLQELVDADVVIADAGSTLYEAWALGKPVIFPDWICKKDVLAKFGPDNLEHQIYAKEIGYHAKDMKHLIRLIDTALSKGMRSSEVEFMERILPSELRGKAGRAAAEALKNIGEEMNDETTNGNKGEN